MTPEQQAYYTELGLRTDIREKSAALKQAMIDMQDAMGRTVGYNAVQFKPLIENLRHRLDDLEAAIDAKEASREA